LSDPSPAKHHVSDIEISKEETNVPGTPLSEMIQSSQGSMPNAETPRESGKEKLTDVTAETAITVHPASVSALTKKAALEMSVKEILGVKNTCPKTLSYNARENIRPDPEFKSHTQQDKKKSRRKAAKSVEKVPLP